MSRPPGNDCLLGTVTACAIGRALCRPGRPGESSPHKACVPSAGRAKNQPECAFGRAATNIARKGPAQQQLEANQCLTFGVVRRSAFWLRARQEGLANPDINSPDQSERGAGGALGPSPPQASTTCALGPPCGAHSVRRYIACTATHITIDTQTPAMCNGDRFCAGSLPNPPPPHRRNTHRSRAHPPSHGALEPRRRARGRILARLFFRAAFQFPPAAMKQPLEARSSSLTPREYACCGCATLLSPETPPFCDHGTCSNCGPRREFVDDCRPLRDI